MSLVPAVLFCSARKYKARGLIRRRPFGGYTLRRTSCSVRRLLIKYAYRTRDNQGYASDRKVKLVRAE